MSIELRHLKYFIALAEELHFGRAALRLAIAQPPLSRQIKKLENEIGIQLFNRTKRTVELTEAGKAFLEHVRRSFEEITKGMNIARSVARGEAGNLSIGFVHSAGYTTIPRIFRLMKTNFPNIRMSLHEMTNTKQLRQLKTNRIDAGLVRTPLDFSEGLEIQIILKDPLVIVMPAKHRLAEEDAVNIEDLSGEPFIQVHRYVATGYYDQFVHICRQAGFNPMIIQSAESAPTIVNLVATGIGISILPSSISGFSRAEVVYKPIRKPSPSSDLAVVWKKNIKTPALLSFLEIAQIYAQEEVAFTQL